ncbi:MAG: hypothetical protein QW735_02095 [archaeon]
MKPKRHIRSLIFGSLSGAAVAAIINPNLVPLGAIFGFLGALIPNLDFNFKTKLGSDTLWVNILLPILFYIALPKSAVVTCFFAGYYGHVINDLDKQNNIEFAKQRALVGMVWIIIFCFISIILGKNLYNTLRLLGSVFF